MKIETVTTKKFVLTELEAKVIHDLTSQLSKNDVVEMFKNPTGKLMLNGNVHIITEVVDSLFCALDHEFKRCGSKK
jgi:hypothetical protein